ncbi:hypothetical protein AVEN_98884-1 [Araneus ventricosus]|uniref:Secreted protein n=1 Tax=Araneus ventricosus TaxID=182803 RepID=A0A4Y2FVL5_ARAVE|nr:hypothetical protein AVEN_98884-1 [Araneus ventricosus]
MNFKLLIWPLRSLANAVCAVLVPSDCRDRPGRFPAYHSCEGGTFQVEFALWIENISDAKSYQRRRKEEHFPLSQASPPPHCRRFQHGRESIECELCLSVKA